MDFFEIVIGALFLALFTYLFYKSMSYVWKEGGPLYYKSDANLAGKTVLITGANCGLGKATALDLAKLGAHLILACRDKEKAEAAAEEIKLESGNENVSVILVDLSDLDSVKLAAETVTKKYDRLDILINNAGIGLTDKTLTKQGFDMIFGTNYLGHFLLTELLLDLLKKSAPSRIINISSIAMHVVWQKLDFNPFSADGLTRFPKLQGYPISKLANYYHVVTLAHLLRETGVTANAVHPGYVKTEIAKRNVKNNPKAFLNKVFLLLANLIGRTAKEGCQTVVYVAVDKDLEKVTGQYFANIKQITDKLSKLARNGDEAEMLSKYSYEMCIDYLPPRESLKNPSPPEKADEEDKKDVSKEPGLTVYRQDGGWENNMYTDSGKLVESSQEPFMEKIEEPIPHKEEPEESES